MGEDRGPLTLAKAKRLKIRHARFPLKRTIGMNCEMNVDACVGAMCDMKAYNDWFFACRWVPARHMVHRATSDDKYRNSYQAHRNLMPNTGRSADLAERNLRLTPARYRDMYKRIARCQGNFDEINAILEEHKF